MNDGCEERLAFAFMRRTSNIICGLRTVFYLY